jgi:sugar/nucleoside kinase (ribokinase family)
MTAHLLQLSGIIFDLLYRVDEIPKPGEEAIVNNFDMKPGGGFNAMVAAKRAGMDVSYGGAIGTGPFASMTAQDLSAEGIAVLRPKDNHRDQGCCTVIIDRHGERSFLASEGADGYASLADLDHINVKNFDWVLLSGYALYYLGSRQAICDWLHIHLSGLNFLFDPSPVVASIPKDILSSVSDNATWISANAHEANIMTGLSDPQKSVEALAKNRPDHGGAIVRDGENGCFIANNDTIQHIPAYRVSPVDTNGAGDTHLGSFIARLAQGHTPVDAATYANIAAALSTTHHGPATAPDESEVLAIQNLHQIQAIRRSV